MVELICKVCSAPFNVLPSKKNITKYCSRECWRKAPKKGKMVKCLTCETLFYVPPYKKYISKYCSVKCQRIGYKGFKHSEASKEKMREFRKKITGNRHPRWKGGKYLTKDGYILMLNPSHPFADVNNYFLEHRLVVEKQIERYLTPKEKVHHRGKRDDNRPYMLMAFASNSAHRRFHHNPSTVKPEEIIFDGRRIKH